MGTQSSVKEAGLIDVGTAKLYHEVRGSGPVLLLISGGVADAGDRQEVAPALLP